MHHNGIKQPMRDNKEYGLWTSCRPLSGLINLREHPRRNDSLTRGRDSVNSLLPDNAVECPKSQRRGR